MSGRSFANAQILAGPRSAPELVAALAAGLAAHGYEPATDPAAADRSLFLALHTDLAGRWATVYDSASDDPLSPLAHSALAQLREAAAAAARLCVTVRVVGSDVLELVLAGRDDPLTAYTLHSEMAVSEDDVARHWLPALVNRGDAAELVSAWREPALFAEQRLQAVAPLFGWSFRHVMVGYRYIPAGSAATLHLRKRPFGPERALAVSPARKSSPVGRLAPGFKLVGDAVQPISCVAGEPFETPGASFEQRGQSPGIIVSVFGAAVSDGIVIVEGLLVRAGASLEAFLEVDASGRAVMDWCALGSGERVQVVVACRAGRIPGSGSLHVAIASSLQDGSQPALCSHVVTSVAPHARGLSLDRSQRERAHAAAAAAADARGVRSLVALVVFRRVPLAGEAELDAIWTLFEWYWTRLSPADERATLRLRWVSETGQRGTEEMALSTVARSREYLAHYWTTCDRMEATIGLERRGFVLQRSRSLDNPVVQACIYEAVHSGENPAIFDQRRRCLLALVDVAIAKCGILQAFLGETGWDPRVAFDRTPWETAWGAPREDGFQGLARRLRGVGQATWLGPELTEAFGARVDSLARIAHVRQVAEQACRIIPVRPEVESLVERELALLGEAR